MEEKIRLAYVFSEPEVKRYAEFSKKLKDDADFLSAFEKANTKEEVYNLLTERQYIDFSFEEFLSRLNKVEELTEKAVGTVELSEEELESVVGGSWIKSNWKNLIKFVPFVGDLTVTAIDIATGEIKGGGNIAGHSVAVAEGIAMEVLCSCAGSGLVGYAVAQVWTRALHAAIKL